MGSKAKLYVRTLVYKRVGYGIFTLTGESGMHVVKGVDNEKRVGPFHPQHGHRIHQKVQGHQGCRSI